MQESQYLTEFNANPGLSKSRLEKLSLPTNLPCDFREFLIHVNGGEGFVGEHYLILHRAEELLPTNHEYNIAEFLPGVFLIGSNGGGEALAIDLRCNPPAYVFVPFIGFDEKEIVFLGNSLAETFERLFKNPNLP